MGRDERAVPGRGPLLVVTHTILATTVTLEGINVGRVDPRLNSPTFLTLFLYCNRDPNYILHNLLPNRELV